ncbi:hypothetical protein RB10731 [Rhodopirellula baltica SH 1]|uniref:Uncharacterized protein n=1 Tax=Rhodopirellula baltica (strain DSM 10527 / NCIMB 13988 / SH1) TaxID=243090 RepID=Q7UKC1_RHOBA|nr:hypothetical protein RB10731 [Rhodopirellula baltica SH 1]
MFMDSRLGLQIVGYHSGLPLMSFSIRRGNHIEKELDR